MGASIAWSACERGVHGLHGLQWKRHSTDVAWDWYWCNACNACNATLRPRSDYHCALCPTVPDETISSYFVIMWSV